jgi:hypothetical protein
VSNVQVQGLPAIIIKRFQGLKLATLLAEAAKGSIHHHVQTPEMALTNPMALVVGLLQVQRPVAAFHLQQGPGG